MTVSNLNQRIQYTADGIVDTFAYNFKIFTNSDLTVVLTSTNDVDTTQILDTDYAVNGAGDNEGGSIVFNSAPTDEYIVTIHRVMPLTQTVDYVENDAFPAASHENALDKLTFTTQQQQDELNRSITVPATDPIGITDGI